MSCFSFYFCLIFIPSGAKSEELQKLFAPIPIEAAVAKCFIYWIDVISKHIHLTFAPQIPPEVG